MASVDWFGDDEALIPGQLRAGWRWTRAGLGLMLRGTRVTLMALFGLIALGMLTFLSDTSHILADSHRWSDHGILFGPMLIGALVIGVFAILGVGLHWIGSVCLIVMPSAHGERGYAVGFALCQSLMLLTFCCQGWLPPPRGTTGVVIVLVVNVMVLATWLVATVLLLLLTAGVARMLHDDTLVRAVRTFAWTLGGCVLLGGLLTCLGTSTLTVLRRGSGQSEVMPLMTLGLGLFAAVGAIVVVAGYLRLLVAARAVVERALGE